MKRSIAILALACALLVALPAQTLMDNSFYQTGSDLAAKADESFELGDYDAAADYAAQAEEYFIKSDEYVAMMVLYQQATDDLARADERYAFAGSVGADLYYPKEYAAAADYLQAARMSMDAEAYALASEQAKSAISALSAVTSTAPLPATYVVEYLPESRDCFWRIAGLPWAYNDFFQWKKLYEANKKKLVDPNNPDLILPGQVIDIPSLYGEKREGQFDPKASYQPFKKPAGKK
jgi:nucleoid-associated protein YgaU